MEEAQELADRVAIIAGGRIVAHGTPHDLSARDGRVTRISFRLPAGVGAGELPPGLGATPATMDEFLIQAKDPVRALNELTGWALERGVELASLEVRQPSLEDVYLELTRVPEGEEVTS
jgi:ABC-2 type transport system ATP-binding protein